MADSSEDELFVYPYINKTLAWHTIDRLEETLSDGGTSHRVNRIAIQTKILVLDYHQTLHLRS